MSDRNHTILVVDDTEENRDLIRRRLERAGYLVLEAEDGRRGIEIVEQEAIDLVILDIMMPGLSGIDVLKVLRRSFSAAVLPIIMATAKDQSEDVVEALDHGANDYVTKPLDFPVVLARVQAQLRARDSAPKRSESVLSDLGSVGPGAVLNGKYRLGEPIGSGNFGTVFRATHLGLQEPVAVKVLQTSVGDSKEALGRFRQEGASAFRMKHQNVVSVLDFQTEEEGHAFLVMELLEGRSLAAELAARGRLPPVRCGEILLPVCDALSAAHGMGILHRDIKPANIFLQKTHRGEVVKVLDFGIAKLVGDAAVEQNLTIDQTVVGTPAYLAPERIQGREYDGRVDVYALGVVLYQMLSGKTPFQSEGKEAFAVAMMHIVRDPEPLRAAFPEASPELEAVVMAALAKEPEDRPDMEQFARRLKQVLADDSTILLSVTERSPTSPAGVTPAAPATNPAVVPPIPSSPVDPRRSLEFDFRDLIEPPTPAGSPPNPVPVFAPQEIGGRWTAD